jgi:hypothetical protein
MFDLVSYALCKIAGAADATREITIMCRDGGIRSTVPPHPPGVDLKELARMLAPILPKDTSGKTVPVIAHVNQGVHNPH